MTGFKKDELLEKSCIGLSAEEDLKRSEKMLERVLEKGYVENFEKACIVKGGRKIYVNMSFGTYAG